MTTLDDFLNALDNVDSVIVCEDLPVKAGYTREGDFILVIRFGKENIDQAVDLLVEMESEYDV